MSKILYKTVVLSNKSQFLLRNSNAVQYVQLVDNVETCDKVSSTKNIKRLVFILGDRFFN